MVLGEEENILFLERCPYFRGVYSVCITNCVYFQPRTARRYTPPPVPTEFPTVPTMRSETICEMATVYVCPLCCMYMYVCTCSNDELKRFLEDKDGSVLAENFVRNLDAVSPVTCEAD